MVDIERRIDKISPGMFGSREQVMDVLITKGVGPGQLPTKWFNILARANVGVVVGEEGWVVGISARMLAGLTTEELRKLSRDYRKRDGTVLRKQWGLGNEGVGVIERVLKELSVGDNS